MVTNLLHLPPLGNSDHICIQFDLLCYLEPKKTDNLKYNTRAANIDLMKQTLGDVDWVSLLDPLDMSDAWLQFRSIFQDALDNCVPTYKPKEKKSLYSNSEVFSLKRKKNHLWKKYLSTRSLIDLANFKSVNNQLRSLTRNLRKDYEKNLAQGVRSRPKAFWQYVNSRTKVRPGVTELVSSDGSAIHSDTEMATHFNEYFSSVFTCEDTTSIPTVDSTSSPLLDDSIEITPETVFSKLIALQSNKSSGPDGWPITIIKSVSEFISVPLSILFNKSLNSGTLPSDWKCANVTPIHKKGARNLACNYRPVSLTSIFSKLMESIVKDHILNHLSTNNLLSPYQFGFIPGRSCSTQLLLMLDYLTHHLDEGYSIDVIYLDFQKAFDTVPHRRLLQKLTSFGIHGNVLKWIESFLSNRVQQVVLNGHKSSTIPVTSGVPQGSVLGPLLFTMFVNEIPSIVSSPVLLFADDTKIFRVIRNREDYTALQSDLDLLQRWSQQWLLNFNISKCKHLHFGPAHHYGPYCLNGIFIDINATHSDLGIVFDDQLKFHHHTTQVTTKANRVLGLIKKSFEYLDSTMLTCLFNTLVRPILEYNNPIWGPHYILDNRKVEKIQRRATRLIPQLQDKSYSERLTQLDLPSFHYRRLRGDLIFLFKILNNYFTTDFTDIYTYSRSITRGHQFKLFKERSRLLCRSNYFINRITNNWNSLPNYVVNISSINTFKSLLDSHLIDSRFIFV